MPICCICEDGCLAGGGDRREKEVGAFLDNQNTVANLWCDWVRLEGGGSPGLSGLGGKVHGSGIRHSLPRVSNPNPWSVTKA